MEKGAKPKQGQSPPPVIDSNPFNIIDAAEEESVVEASADGGYDISDAPSSTVFVEKNTSAREATTISKPKGDAPKRNQVTTQASKAAREIKRQRDVRQQAETAAAQRAKRVAQHLKRNADEKKRSHAARTRRSADHQRMIHLCEKYGSFFNACKVMDLLDRPTKTKLKKLKARIAAANADIEERRAFSEKIKRAEEANNVDDITAAVAESWRKREQPTSILDTGYSGKNIIKPDDAQKANLPNLGPSRNVIVDANGGMARASQTTRVN